MTQSCFDARLADRPSKLKGTCAEQGHDAETDPTQVLKKLPHFGQSLIRTSLFIHTHIGIQHDSPKLLSKSLGPK